MAAPRRSPQSVGGWYNIIGGELEDDGGDGERSSLSLPEYCSESEGMVIEDSLKGLVRSSDAIVQLSSPVKEEEDIRSEICVKGKTLNDRGLSWIEAGAC